MGRTVLVTGGAGFVGSALVRALLARNPELRVVSYDRLSTGGRAENLELPAGLATRHRLVVGDLRDRERLTELCAQERPTWVVHLAAESHVDRAIASPRPFVDSAVAGTLTLLEVARAAGVERFLHASTDEVYGPILVGRAVERAPLAPSNPYAAAKAGAEHLARAWHRTYGLPVVVTRASNTYGPRQHPEKLIPKLITAALRGRPLPLYGDGRQRRDWLHVEDHVAALLVVLERGRPGEVYNVAAGCERTNLEVAMAILELVGAPRDLIRHVPDRPGHDRRYALDTGRIRALGWRPRIPFAEGLARTVDWYREHASWWRPLVEPIA